MPIPTRIHGLKPDPPDLRDFHFRTHWLKIGKMRQKLRALLLPDAVDLREEGNLPVLDQGSLGSCVDNALATTLGHVTNDQGDGLLMFSRLFMYGNARGWVPEDDGSTLRDALKGVDRYGVPLESMWPYDLSRWKDKPPQEVWDAAYHREEIDYYRLDTLDGMRICLAKDRKPFIFGIQVYSGFRADAPDYTIPMPRVYDRLEGGHAMCCVGYDNRRQALLVRNSWGTDWGMAGHCWLPYAYVGSGHWFDAWTVRRIKA